MKKAAFILAVFILSLSLFACTPNDPTIPAGMMRVTNDVINFNLYVPEGWTESISTGAVGAYCSNEDPTNATVMAWNVDQSTTLDGWWESYKSEIELVFDEVTLTSQESTTVRIASGGSVAAMKYAYTAKLGSNEYNYVQCASLHWGMIYIITITTTPAHYEEHTEDIANILQYFEFH